MTELPERDDTGPPDLPECGEPECGEPMSEGDYERYNGVCDKCREEKG